MTRDEGQRTKDHSLAIACAATVFLSAFLLFQVQPIISKAILPWFGGTPGVWSTCLLVFQSLLLAGYAYAHATTKWLTPRAQTLVHLGLLVAAAAALPILPGVQWKPTPGEAPALQIVLTVLAGVGLPFAVLSTTGPLLQVWWFRAHQGRSPYRLYALSNAGSLLALLSYPFVVEPALTLAQQSIVWSSAFALFAVLCSACGVATLARSRFDALVGQAASLPEREQARTEADRFGHELGRADLEVRPATPARYALWFALAAVPSIMLLATTNQICLDVAAVPFLWVLPLSLYLVSFILTFDSPRWYSRPLWAVLFAASAIAVTATLLGAENASIPFQVASLLSGLFATAMVCHGELARLKPHPSQLTSFYLVLAAAGAAGGAFVSLLAPVLFDSFLELPLALLATMALVLPLYFRDPKWRLAGGRPTWVGRVSVVGALFVAAGLVYGSVRERRDVIHTSRDFYGILRVMRTPLASQDDALVQLIHGRITHGAQYTSESRRSQPTLYFGRQSGAGLAIQHHRKGDGPRHLGVIGLGAGTLAVYGRPQDRVRFYEINPEVVRLAREYFSFLADCPARCDVVLGDARLVMEAELERGDPQGFDVLALDAFSSDSIPTHLLTREAVQVYLRHLRPDGILAVHISNRHFDLAPVLAELAQQESLASRVVESRADLDGIVSHWVLLSPHAESLDAPVFEGLPSLAGSRTVAWTDDHCSLLAVLRPLTPDRLLFVAGDNDEFVVHAQRGISLLESGNLPSAEAEFRAALKIDARNAGAWLHLGNVLRLKSQQEDAVACYERAIKFDPSSSEAYNNLGGMLASRDAARAQECLHQALQLDPRNARTHSNLGNLLARRRELDAAIAHYEQALAIDPELADARKNLAIVQQWQREGDPKAPQ